MARLDFDWWKNERNDGDWETVVGMYLVLSLTVNVSSCKNKTFGECESFLAGNLSPDPILQSPNLH